MSDIDKLLEQRFIVSAVGLDAANAAQRVVQRLKNQPHMKGFFGGLSMCAVRDASRIEQLEVLSEAGLARKSVKMPLDLRVWAERELYREIRRSEKDV